MVDIKREDLTLQDWTKGISADEYAWGSYFYSEWISSGYNTKGFELWYKLKKYALNNRTNGYATALAPTWLYGFAAFTRDGRIETEDFWNWAANTTGDADWWGALYAFKPQWWIGNWYLNWAKYWDYLFWIRQTRVDFIKYEDLFDPTNEKLSNTHLTSATWWTLGTWWTTTDEWATHTPWNTATLVSSSIAGTYSNSDLFRCAIKIKNWTAGTITVNTWGADTETFTDASEWWIVATLGWASTVKVTITPSSTFDGTIEYVNLHQYDTSKLSNASISGWAYSNKHPALVWEWDLYIASRNYVNIYNLSDFWQTYKELIDKNFEIVAMNQQAWNIIIWATDGYDSRQYYWNWVDAVATEVIEWKWLIIQSATGTETISYVLTTSGQNSWSIEWYEYRLYAVSGYQRNLIASKLYQFGSDGYLEASHYNENKKFDFNDVTDEHWMVVFLDSLCIPWCDGVYKYGYDVPWLRSNWTRPITYDTWATNIILGQRWHYLGVAFRANWVNYISDVDNRLYTSTWFLVTESIYWDKLSSRKALEKLKIWYKSVASTVGNIKMYVIVDDTYFWRFRPTSTPTNRPEIWDIYNIAHSTTWEVINVDKTNWVITFRTISNTWSRAWLANISLTKISGEWDDTITVWYNYDNMCLIKTIESEQQGYNSDLVFGKDFVNNYLPFWHKIQFVIELNSNSDWLSPEIYELSINSDITDITL